MIFTLVFCGAGFFGFGISLYRQMPWFVPYGFELSVFFGLAFIKISTYGYITDCLRDRAPEAFASLALTKLYEFGKN